MDQEQQLKVQEMIAAIESMDGETLAAMMPPSPDPSVYTALYPALAQVETRDVAVSGPHGEVPCRIYRHPSIATGASLVWVHGGGFAHGHPNEPLLPAAARSIERSTTWVAQYTPTSKTSDVL